MSCRSIRTIDEVLLYNDIWPKEQSGYISGVCETEQKDVLYIVFSERATPASMQATNSVECKKKTTVKSMS